MYSIYRHHGNRHRERRLHMATYYHSTFVGTLTFDVGSVVTRAGFAGDDCPRSIYPSSIGVWVDDSGCQNHAVMERKNSFNPATLARIQTRQFVPANAGGDLWILRNLLEHGLKHLGCTSWTEHPVVLSEPTDTSTSTRRQTAEFMFEELGVPALCISRAAELIAISLGHATASVLEVGGDASTAAVVADGAVIARSVRKSKLGGTLLAQMLMKSLSQLPSSNMDGSTPPNAPSAQHDVSLRNHIRDQQAWKMLESVGRCVETRAASQAQRKAGVAAKTAVPVEYTLPDGRTIEVRNEGHSACEHLFDEQQQMDSHGMLPLQSLVIDAITSVEPDMHKELLRHTILAGGLSL